MHAWSVCMGASKAINAIATSVQINLIFIAKQSVPAWQD